VCPGNCTHVIFPEAASPRLRGLFGILASLAAIASIASVVVAAEQTIIAALVVIAAANRT